MGSFTNSGFYRALDFLGNLFLLNILWLLLCIPLVTAFPATAAMFGVVRDWTRNRDEYPLGRFFHHFRANLAQSLGIGLLWTVLGGILALDFLVLDGFDLSVRLPLLVLLWLVTLAYAAASIYLFPVMVNYELRWWNVIRNSLFMAFGQLGTTVLCLLTVVLAALIFLIVPITVLLLGSVTAHILYFLCQRAFRRIESLKKQD